MRTKYLAVLLLASSCWATAPSFVQSKFCSASATSGACAYTSDVTAGSLLSVMCVGSRSGANLIVTDNWGGDTFTLINGTTTKNSGSGVAGVWYAYNAHGGPTTVTCSDTRALTTWVQVTQGEWTGERTVSSPFDVASTSAPVTTEATTTMTAGAMNLVTYDSLIVQFCTFGLGAATGQTGNLRQNDVDNAYQMLQDTGTFVPAQNYESTFTAASNNKAFICIQAEFGSPAPLPPAFTGVFTIQ